MDGESLLKARGNSGAIFEALGQMLLALLILLAARANLGSLFAAHAADRSGEVAKQDRRPERVGG